MFISIVQHAPTWVWVLLAALIALGVSQSFPRLMTVRRATLVPAALVGLSLYGVISAFGAQPLALAAWAAGLAAATLAAGAAKAWRGVRWAADQQRLQVPGSWLPMGLILALFTTKFGVGATLAMHPGFAADTSFAVEAGLVYGAFSGLFLARAVVMWKVAREAFALSA
jgi:hypothetical protein